MLRFKNIFFIIFYFAAGSFLLLSNEPSKAFLNRLSEEQNYDCKTRASYQQNEFSAKQTYKDCLKAYKEQNKYYKICSNNLFERYKENLEDAIYSYSFGDINEINSLIDKLDINKKSNSNFKLSEIQNTLLSNQIRFEYDEITKFKVSQDVRLGVNNVRESILKECDQIIKNKQQSKSYMKFF